jgi:monoamine oxidase
MPTGDADVIVIGAGTAGLTAARELERVGFRVICLEARDRIGGRILTVHDAASPVPVELGAEFVHGRPAEILDFGLPLRETLGDMVHLEAPGAETWRVMEDIERLGCEQNDESFLSFIGSHRYTEGERQSATGYVEGFNAARKERIGIASLGQDAQAAAAIDGDRSFHIVAGYDSLMRAIAPSDVRLNTIVESIEWRRGAASVLLRGRSEPLRAARVVVTVPLGVLQAGDLRFDPEPAETLEAARALEFGQAYRVTLLFDRAFWKDNQRLAGASFILSNERVFPVWWTALPDTPLLTGWSAGPKADPLIGKSQSEIVSLALGSLQRIAGVPPGRLEKFWMHDWQADPFARGAYSYVPAGALPARRKFAEPVADTLYFAGEATDLVGYGGTVHGAIASAHRAVRQIVG